MIVVVPADSAEPSALMVQAPAAVGVQVAVAQPLAPTTALIVVALAPDERPRVMVCPLRPDT
ncbi:unannotated protein [freshwater metagenome]|uniref:Unannotated protein n=1 Tax=freshwater metagenome TaxID=449393 RepID=A0A6J7HLC7_9ZZZZ